MLSSVEFYYKSQQQHIRLFQNYILCINNIQKYQCVTGYIWQCMKTMYPSISYQHILIQKYIHIFHDILTFQS